MTLPATRMIARDTASVGDARVTIKAVIAAHHGSSECNASAASTAKVTDAAASAASNPRAAAPLERTQFDGERAGNLAQHRVGLTSLNKISKCARRIPCAA